MPPIYDYFCRQCESEYSVFYKSQSAVLKEEKTEVCPACGSKRKKRTVSKSTTHILKGKCWERDGYS